MKTEPKFNRGDLVGWKSDSDFTASNRLLKPMRVVSSTWDKQEVQWVYKVSNYAGDHSEYELESRELECFPE